MGNSHSKRKNNKKNSIKCVFLGEETSGKTIMLISYTNGAFPDEYTPTVFDNYETCFDFNGQSLLLGLWDTAGKQDYDRIRRLSYVSTDTFVLCFSVVDPKSLQSVRERWVPEILEDNGNIPFILVGCKTDLREDEQIIEELKKENMVPVSFEEAKLFSQQIGAAAYVECSAKTGKNLQNVFTTAVEVGLMDDPPLPHLTPSGMTVKRAR